MSVANSYAKALYQQATESGVTGDLLDQLDQQLDELVTVLAGSKAASALLVGPLTNSSEKVGVVEALAKRLSFSPLLSKFLILVARKRRLGLLKEIRDSFRSVRLAAEGGMLGSLVTSDPMGEEDVAALASAFGKKLGKRVAFNVSTDPSLLAGVKVTVNGVTYDGTLRSQLHQLRDRITLGVTGNQ